MAIRFLVYGFFGLVMEVLWTGFHSLIARDVRLTATTSLWMFPIYGMVVFMEVFFVLLSSMPAVFRGSVYMLLIFLAEYAAGGLLKCITGACPWDYSASKYNINSIIRVDYAPVWFAVGLLYERLFYIL